jgi:glycerol-3-phosphate dehydrogenase
MLLPLRGGSRILAVRSRKVVYEPRRSFWWSSNSSGGNHGGSTRKNSSSHHHNANGRPWAFRHHATSSKSSSSLVAGPDDDIPSRSQQLGRLFRPRDGQTSQVAGGDGNDDDDVEYDLLVVGGGATGCGIALDAASRGLRVVCCERGDFGAETSSRSTKLIWAGIRYLATATARLLNQDRARYYTEPMMIWREFVSEFTMVNHCHRERRYMLDQQRHLTHWMPIAVPFTSYLWAERREGQPPPFGNAIFQLFPGLAPFVFKFYDALSRFTCPPSYVLGTKSAKVAFPQLLYNHAETGRPYIRYLAVFYEAMHNDARTNLAIAMSAAQYGAVMCNYTKVVDLIKDNNDNTGTGNASGRVTGAIVEDQLTGRRCHVYARKVVLAGGPFTDELRSMEVEARSTTVVPPAVRGGAGTHIVVPGTFPMGLLDYNTSDGRFLFILPWLNHTLIGTTDVPGTAQTRHDPPEAEIEFLLHEASRYLATPYSRRDVLSAWRGWRPLAHDPHAAEGGPLSRDHVISEHPISAVLFIAGGKWTTWREMAQDVVDRIVVSNNNKNKNESPPPCRTLDIVLHGGGEDAAVLKQELVDVHGLDHAVATHLVDTYGKYARSVATYFAEYGTDPLVAGFPYLRAEIPFACREYACTVEDILSRRTRLAFLNIRAAEAAVEPVADIMSQTLGWSKQAKQAQMEAARDFLKSFGGPEPV